VTAIGNPTTTRGVGRPAAAAASQMRGDGVLAQRLRSGHPRDRTVGLAAGERQHLGSERGDQDRTRRRAGHGHVRVHPELVADEAHLARPHERPEHREVFAHVRVGLRERQSEHPSMTIWCDSRCRG
jgi:hypothetical protein